MFDKILDFLFSMKLMTMLMLIFAVAVGYATFVENAHNTLTARIYVYSATWFEMLLFLLTINLIGTMIVRNLFKKEKISILLFHLSFAIILIGAGISREFGFEGSMMIAEGESSNIMYSKDPHLQVKYGVLSPDGQIQDGYEYKEHMLLSPASQRMNYFERELPIPVHKPLHVEYVDFKEDVVYDAVPGNGNGNEYLLFKVPDQSGGRDTLYLKSGAIRNVGGVVMAFNNDERTDAVRFYTTSTGDVEFISPYDATTFDPDNMEEGQGPMMGGQPQMDSLDRDTSHVLQFRQPYFFQNSSIFYEAHYSDVNLKWVDGEGEDVGDDFLFIRLSVGKTSIVKPLRYNSSETASYYNFLVEDVHVSIGYGPKEIRLPFFVKCIDFKLERYRGTGNPSNFECEVAIDDPENDSYFEANIFMNNFLDYGGYRFFQSSYQTSPEAAQRGEGPDTTVLSVNHDRDGTIVTYIGYLLMALGFIWSLFNKNSRFTMLRRKVKEYSVKKSGAALILVLLSLNATSGDVDKSTYVDEAKSLLLLEHKGRVSPLQTHAIDVLYKLKKSRSHTPSWSDQSYSPIEVYLSMMANPEPWYKEKVIKLHKTIKEFLNTEESYASVYDLADTAAFDSGMVFINAELSAEQRRAHRVENGEKSKFDQEIIKLYDNLDLLLWVLSGDRFKVYPLPNTKEEIWVSSFDLKTGKYKGEDAEMMSKLNRWLLTTLEEADSTGNYTDAMEALTNLKEYQRNVGRDLPSRTKVSMEVMYNDMNIFFKIMIVYAMMALFLLPFLLWDVFTPNRRWLHILIKIFFWSILAFVLLHAFGLALRWYVVGHAPWSNGYEALVFIGFIAMVAGLIFYKASRFTIGAATLLASLILGIAHGASTDPELTNLVPVLKSVWLVIHVAVITSSYGFLGLGAVLGLINVVLYIFRGTKPKGHTNITINELTTTSELTMTIGLYLAAIGTFLGGVWANESWGRYWGWDAKETWALVIVLSYSLLLHIRFIPFLKGKLLFNVLSVVMFSTVIMTYFGVNYYLTKGLHSYARGEASGLPLWVIITIIGLIAMFIWAFIQNDRYKRKLKR